MEEPDGNRMAVSGIPSDGVPRGVSGTILFGVLVSDAAGSGTPESLYSLFGIFDGGHGELRKVPVQHVDVQQSRISPTLCTRIINHGLRTP